jgi:hypothetical protein
VVTPPPTERSPAGGPGDDPRHDPGDGAWDAAAAAAAGEDDGDGAIARINLRLPDQLKSRVERAAAAEGQSVNAWLVRAAAAALQRTDPARRAERRSASGSQRVTGWAR